MTALPGRDILTNILNNQILSRYTCGAGSQLLAEGSGKAGWVDPTRSDDSPAKQVVALRQRLVAAERERKQSMADAAAENRALQLQLQVHLADSFHCNCTRHYYLQLRTCSPQLAAQNLQLSTCSSKLAAEAAAENRALQSSLQISVTGSFA